MKRPQILFFTIHPPRMPGRGGEVRTYYSLEAAIRFGEVTLVYLGGADGKTIISTDILKKCKQVIQPFDKGTEDNRTIPLYSSRLSYWLFTVKTLVFPWRNNWFDFVTLCMQHWYPARNPKKHFYKNISQHVLRLLVRNEFRFLSLLFKIPPLAVILYAKAMERTWPEVRNLLKHASFDIVWFEHSFSYPFVKKIHRKVNSVKLVCNAHNMEANLQSTVTDLASAKWKIMWGRAQVRLLKSLEKESFRACDLVITCSKEDKDTGEALSPSTDFRVIGNGVNTEYFYPVSLKHRAEKPTLLFTGGFAYEPNMDALQYFIQDIFPIIKQIKPECRFLFAGSAARKAWEKLSLTDESIEFVSDPVDIRPSFYKAWVFVVPLRAGSGTRLKILEAMAVECAIVSTRIGAEGIPCRDGEHLLLADSRLEFADQVLRLLGNDSLRISIGKKAGEWVRKHYGWDLLCGKMTEVLEEKFSGKCTE